MSTENQWITEAKSLKEYISYYSDDPSNIALDNTIREYKGKPIARVIEVEDCETIVNSVINMIALKYNLDIKIFD
jgi:hypothetical protein